jgi:Transposase IS4
VITFWRFLAISENDRFLVSEAQTSLDLLRHSSKDDSEAENAANDSDGSAVDQEDAEFAPLPYVPAPVQEQAPNPWLRPNGHQWSDDGEISVDVGLLNRRTRLIWPGNVNLLGDPLPVRTELDYFRLFYPMQLNHGTLEKTNDKLDPTGRKPRLTEDELLTYFGIRLNMTLDRKRLDVREYWEDEVRPGSTFTPPDYGRFGMTRHRFQAISKCLRFSDYDEGIVNQVYILHTTSFNSNLIVM